ncbi:MAG: metallopeptidase family protein [Methyloceanibacter sp.]
MAMHARTLPTISDFEQAANEAFAQLPGTFREMTKDVVIRVEGLLGLYHGVDLTRQSVLDVSPIPEMIFLYRRPILAYWESHDEALEDIIAHVLIHEIGHHFGLSDADMERIESEAAN